MTRETLTSDQIVAAAIALLDRDGFDGLNMRALGERLGSAATAVYWHVGSKANLIALAGDQVWNEIPLPDLRELGWRDAASAMATELNAMFTRHPWLVQAFGAYPIFGPGKARHDDHCLAMYEAAGFTPGDADRAATAVFTYVLGTALGHAAAISLGRVDNEDELRATMTRAHEVALQFPRLAARIGSPAAAYAASPEGTFELGLNAILDGLEAQLPHRRRRS
jgi:AcrR family transcriptional regulator